MTSRLPSPCSRIHYILTVSMLKTCPPMLYMGLREGPSHYTPTIWKELKVLIRNIDGGLRKVRRNTREKVPTSGHHLFLPSQSIHPLFFPSTHLHSIRPSILSSPSIAPPFSSLSPINLRPSSLSNPPLPSKYLLPCFRSGGLAKVA